MPFGNLQGLVSAGREVSVNSHTHYSYYSFSPGMWPTGTQRLHRALGTSSKSIWGSPTDPTIFHATIEPFCFGVRRTIYE